MCGWWIKESVVVARVGRYGWGGGCVRVREVVGGGRRWDIWGKPSSGSALAHSYFISCSPFVSNKLDNFLFNTLIEFSFY